MICIIADCCSQREKLPCASNTSGAVQSWVPLAKQYFGSYLWKVPVLFFAFYETSKAFQDAWHIIVIDCPHGRGSRSLATDQGTLSDDSPENLSVGWRGIYSDTLQGQKTRHVRVACGVKARGCASAQKVKYDIAASCITLLSVYVMNLSISKNCSYSPYAICFLSHSLFSSFPIFFKQTNRKLDLQFMLCLCCQDPKDNMENADWKCSKWKHFLCNHTFSPPFI